MWRALTASNLGVAADLDGVMRDLLATRWQLARNADEVNFRDYQWKVLDRVDYTPPTAPRSTRRCGTRSCR